MLWTIRHRIPNLAEKWLSVMRTAHKMGLKTNATLLYNHLETPEDIVNHRG